MCTIICSDNQVQTYQNASTCQNRHTHASLPHGPCQLCHLNYELSTWLSSGFDTQNTRALFQYPIRCLIVRSHKVLKTRDLYSELSDYSEIWQCCQHACQISKQYDNLNCQSHGFETSRNLTIRRLIRYQNGAQDISIPCQPKGRVLSGQQRWFEISDSQRIF